MNLYKTHKTPIDYYHEQCSKGTIVYDAQQLFVMKHFQQLQLALCREHQKRSRAFAFLRTPQCIRGLYVWGGVGVGKTWMMDCFYQTLPIGKKSRLHFHQFMQMIHKELVLYQGETNPLEKIAKKIAKKTMVLCFDEFFVSDIVDAMLLGKLLTALFSEGVSVIFTSNVTPDDLYKDGLQRALFLPAIDMIKKHALVLCMRSNVDYRLRHSEQPERPVKMEEIFSLFAQGTSVNIEPIDIGGRLIKIKKSAEAIVWLDFKAICSPPRSHHDYLEMVKKYHTIFISDIPLILAHEKDTICLFIRLIDVMYDARVRLVYSAEVDIDKIYTEGHKIFEYQRTRSRLMEMQSASYARGVSICIPANISLLPSDN